jgi:hypothetical protein
VRIELQDDLHDELGYREAGRREVALREWFTLRGEKTEVAPTPKAFGALVNRLRVKKWVKENPEKRAAISKRYFTKKGVADRQLELARKRRHDRWKASNPIVVCSGCSVEFCPMAPKRGVQRQFCTTNCEARCHQARQRRKAGAKATCCGICGCEGHNARRHHG